MNAAAWVQAGATVVLVAITAWYAIRISRATTAAEASAKSAERSARAAERSAAIAEQSLRVTSTPVVVWASLSGKVNDAGNPELDYRVTNTGPVAALEVALAPIRYAVNGEPRQEPFRNVTSVLGPGQSYPTEGAQEGSMVIPASGDNKANWIHAVGNDSYGLVALYRDFAGRRWRSEMGLAVGAPVSLELVDDGPSGEATDDEAEEGG